MDEFTFETGGKSYRRRSDLQPSGACLQRLSRPASVGFSLTILMAVCCLPPAVHLLMGLGSCSHPRPPRSRDRAREPMGGQARRAVLPGPAIVLAPLLPPDGLVITILTFKAEELPSLQTPWRRLGLF
jgi:hypothetical protein